MGRILSVSNYIINCKKQKGALSGKRIAAISDLHSCTFGKENENLVQKIIKYTPDLLVISGDMITGARPDKAYIALDFLEKISSFIPVIYSFGNHERRCEDFNLGSHEKPAVYIKNEQKSGFDYKDFLHNINKYTTLLRNSHTTAFGDDQVKIYGLDAPLDYYMRSAVLDTDTLRELLGDCDRDCFNILLAHDPAHFAAYEQWGADIVISGHIHGGIIRLPFVGGLVSPRYEFFPKYSAGRYCINSTTMLLSRGLGSHTIPIRIFNSPEVMIIDFK